MSESARSVKKTAKKSSRKTGSARSSKISSGNTDSSLSKTGSKRSSVRKPSSKKKTSAKKTTTTRATSKKSTSKKATTRKTTASKKTCKSSRSVKNLTDKQKKPSNKACEAPTKSGRKKTSTGTAASSRSKAGSSGKAKSKTRKRKAATRPIVNKDTSTLLNLESLLGERIVGKDSAIQRVANVIRIRRTKLDFKPHRPDGSFLIVGPAGVGKAEFANAVAEVLLGDNNRVLNLDMADFTMEEDIEDLLVTAYPGTEGVLVEGAMTTPIRNNPRTVILFRGIERAHPAILRLLLHTIERGVVMDAQGEATFNESIIFATTRLELDEAEMVEQIGFTRSTIPREERCHRILEEQFSPELVGAFNEVLYFNSLTPQDVKLIARYKVNSVLERLKAQKCGVIITDRVYDTFILEDEVKKAGARYLNRALEEKLFTPLSKYLLGHATARSIIVDIQDGELVIKH